jgi:aspartyl-tRNA synthetase
VDLTAIVRSLRPQGFPRGGGKRRDDQEHQRHGAVRDFSRKDLDDLTAYVGQFGAKGLAWVKIKEDGEWQSPIAKFFTEEEKQRHGRPPWAESGDLLFFVADKPPSSTGPGRTAAGAGPPAGPDRPGPFFLCLGHRLSPAGVRPGGQAPGRGPSPFHRPHEEDLALLASEPGKVRSRAYDLVLNGTEIGGGSIRIHRKDLQERVFAALGITPEEVSDKFDFLVRALELGAPPHGGLAFGLDRLMMIIAGATPSVT